MIKYRVEMKFAHGWDDAEWSENGEPLRFDTPEDADDEISDFLTENLRAVRRGDMTHRYRRCEFRVAVAPAQE